MQVGTGSSLGYRYVLGVGRTLHYAAPHPRVFGMHDRVLSAVMSMFFIRIWKHITSAHTLSGGSLYWVTKAPLPVLIAYKSNAG